MEETNFSLDTPFINNYVNWIWVDVQRYQEWSSRRWDPNVGSINRTKLALRRLLINMPLKGLHYVESEAMKIPEFRKINDVLDLKSYEQTDMVFRIAMNWLQPNLFELQINTAKPAYSSLGHLGNETHG
jgi:hypothetical protein